MFEIISKETWEKSHCFRIFDESLLSYLEKYDNISIPERSTKKSAGYDFKSPFRIYYPVDSKDPIKEIIIPTGIKWNPEGLAVPNNNIDNCVLMLYPRSSLGFKNNFRFCNTIPIIDADYYNNKDNEGHIIVKFKISVETNEFNINIGDKIFQGIIQSFYNYPDENIENVRISGIGSTNKQ